MKSVANKSLLSLHEAVALIQSGKNLLISGDESLLAALPNGNWIGGTIPYFMCEEGCLSTRERLQVAVLPGDITAATVRFYEAGQLPSIPTDYLPNGFSYIVIPAFSEAHRRFAEDCASWPGVFDSPLIGWIAGVDLGDIGKSLPKVFNGQTGESSIAHAAVMHLGLPKSQFAQANIINLFAQGSGDTLTFPAAGFEASDCFVNGEKRNFAEYIAARHIDTHLPLVANYTGAMINVSFQEVDPQAGIVRFYAPIFPGVEYKLADPVEDYESAFCSELHTRQIEPLFTCNCILNYLYAKLEGKKTGGLVGPITFGEIAYMLLNQTLVYLTIETH